MTAMDTTLRDRLIRDQRCIACLERPATRHGSLYCQMCMASISQINARQMYGTQQAARAEIRRQRGTRSAA
jgi:hypothetical protein